MKLPKICNISPSFKGWTKPGPLPAQPLGRDLELGEGETIDALSGHFRIFQLRAGHRFSTDDIITAWYGTTCAPSVARVLDLGSGIGSVAMTAAWRLPFAKFVTIEAQEASVALARKSVAYNGLEDRFDLRLGDFRDPDVLADDETFDLVMGSPPYWPLEDGLQAEHPQKIACRFEVRGDVADYAARAAKHLAPGGMFVCVFPADQRERVVAGAKAAGLCVVRRKPVYFRADDPPRLDLWAMVSATDLPEEWRDRTWVEEPLIVRDEHGEIHPMYAAIKMSFGFPPGG